MQHLLHESVVKRGVSWVLRGGHDERRLRWKIRHLGTVISLSHVNTTNHLLLMLLIAICNGDIPTDYHAFKSTACTIGHMVKRLAALLNLLVFELGDDRVAGRAMH